MQQQMGGVGLVFYRDENSPYLIVKDVVHDGPAFRSSLVYPGDRLCCINDFDLAWSDATPRAQQRTTTRTSVTCTSKRRWPQRQTRAMAWASSEGFHDGSNSIIRDAPVSVSPTPPARNAKQSKKKSSAPFSLDWASCRASNEVAPSMVLQGQFFDEANRSAARKGPLNCDTITTLSFLALQASSNEEAKAHLATLVRSSCVSSRAFTEDNRCLDRLTLAKALPPCSAWTRLCT